MKKFITTLLFLFMICLPSNALNVVVESLSSVNEDTEKDYFQAKVLEKAEFDSGLTFEAGTILNGKIIKKVEAKRGKRNAYLIISPLSYEYENVVQTLKHTDYEAKVVGYSKRDLKKMGLDAGLAVGGHFVKGASEIFYFSKGLIKPAKGKSRLGSAVTEAYENSPFVYIEKGNDIAIEEGDMLILKFYHSDISKLHVIKRQK